MPEDVEIRKFSSKRPFGIELEVSNTVSQNNIANCIIPFTKRHVEVTAYAQSYNNKYWHVKTDSSCGPLGKPYDTGFEIASFKASGHKDLKEIGLVADSLVNGGVVVNNNCGYHIHVEVKDFTPEQMGILVARWVKIEHVLANMVPVRRVGNKHCRMISKTRKYRSAHEYSAKDFWELMRPNNLATNDNNQRKFTLNLVNFAYALYCEQVGGGTFRKTVELRLPEGTLNSDDIKNWVRLFVLFVDTAKNVTKMPKNLKAIMTLGDFMRVLGLGKNNIPFSSALKNTRIWIMERIKTFGTGNLLKQASRMLEIEKNGLEASSKEDEFSDCIEFEEPTPEEICIKKKPCLNFIEDF